MDKWTSRTSACYGVFIVVIYCRLVLNLNFDNEITVGFIHLNSIGSEFVIHGSFNGGKVFSAYLGVS